MKTTSTTKRPTSGKKSNFSVAYTKYECGNVVLRLEVLSQTTPKKKSKAFVTSSHISSFFIYLGKKYSQRQTNIPMDMPIPYHTTKTTVLQRKKNPISIQPLSTPKVAGKNANPRQKGTQPKKNKQLPSFQPQFFNHQSPSPPSRSPTASTHSHKQSPSSSASAPRACS